MNRINQSEFEFLLLPQIGNWFVHKRVLGMMFTRIVTRLAVWLPFAQGQ